MLATLSGGISAKIGGRKFANGALSGAAGRLFGDMYSSGRSPSGIGAGVGSGSEASPEDVMSMPWDTKKNPFDSDQTKKIHVAGKGDLEKLEKAYDVLEGGKKIYGVKQWGDKYSSKYNELVDMLYEPKMSNDESDRIAGGVISEYRDVSKAGMEAADGGFDIMKTIIETVLPVKW